VVRSSSARFVLHKGNTKFYTHRRKNEFVFVYLHAQFYVRIFSIHNEQNYTDNRRTVPKIQFGMYARVMLFLVYFHTTN